jgi:hypothetical protein
MDRVTRVNSSCHEEALEEALEEEVPEEEVPEEEVPEEEPEKEVDCATFFNQTLIDMSELANS